MRASLVEAGVRIISGHGRLEGDDAVIVSTGPGGTDFDRIEADTFVVSIGSSPRELPTAMPDGERILTWTQLYEMTGAARAPHRRRARASPAPSSPRRYMNLGAKVTLVSSRDQVLPGEDKDAAAVLEKRLQARRHDGAVEVARRQGRARRATACSSRSRTAAPSRAATA